MDNLSTLLFTGVSFQPLLLAVNAQSTTILGAVILMLLLLSFFVSGAKLAFFSLTFRDVNMLKTKQDTGWKRIATLLEEPRKLQASLTVANTLINIAIIILSNYLIDEILIFDEAQEGSTMMILLRYAIKVLIIASLIILFGEVLPKIRATQNNLRSAYETSFLVEVLYYVFRRIGDWMIGLSDSVEKFFGGSTARASIQLQLEADIKKSVTQEGEQKILAGIYKFADITVKQVMRTRLDVSGIEYGISFGELKKRVEDLHYSRLPVYKGSLDDIVGIVQTKDIVPHLLEPDTFDWHTILRTPYFVHEQKYIEDLLGEFQKKHIHFAVVVDEFGGTSGIITLEDIMEEIVGEIKDEFDEEESTNKKIDDHTYIFEGSTMIHDVCSIMGLAADTFDQVRGESDSLAGLVLELAGEIPKVNDTINVGDFDFVVLEIERNRIKKVKVVVNPHAI
ncbi:gliding motility-associated protein GldE [Pseudobacter ginsenosidimutans]|uniref:Gliding motility-associated protein GldE n=1 Tax=Pseudobacter ginsenosidimutans TaxID=661488 RepID=A0A4Q7MSG0_9BACT|nr:gliding motility-associated protein GldE [Pseudobacter ginsenosidimutans]RZS71398.1 gliding motility-associated protein GldE [Pseudobacter ginsenosidimutans]